MKIVQEIATMQAAINGYDGILRVVAAYPLVANLASNSRHVRDALEEDKTPLATLSPTAFVEVLSTQRDGKSCVEQLNRKVYSGVRGNEEEDNAEDQMMVDV